MFDVSSDVAANITRIAVALVPMLLGMVLHEVAHGYTAFRLGDPTATSLGRLTLNPLAHLDAAGSLLFAATALFGPFILGWAKPVPVQPRYFKNPRQGMILVSIAGPLANFFLALVFGGVYSLTVHALMNGSLAFSTTVKFLLNAAFMGVWINLTLGWFNLLPIPSLDGGQIVAGLLPYHLAERLYSLDRYGLIILMVLLGTGMLHYIMGPLLNFSMAGIGSLFAIPPKLF